MARRTTISLATCLLTGFGLLAQPADRPRARDLGLAPGTFATGPLNAITDVPGVMVGQVTLTSQPTGVTAILPHGGNLFQDKVLGAVFVGNAFGKLAGSTQVEELGTIETPIVLTNTLAVGTAMDAVVRWTLAQPGNGSVRSVNAVVGETNDGTLNDIRSLPVTRDHVLAAITAARSGAVDEGAVGAGAGTIAFNWKGGIGTSSRVVVRGATLDVTKPPAQNIPEMRLTIGVLVQTNFGGKLTMGGVPVWEELRADGPGFGVTDTADGSCMIVVATDAPIDARDLKRLAARAVFALARTGSTFSNGSGDFAIAFSTRAENRVSGAPGPQPRVFLSPDAMSPLFEAVMDATEEAVYNSLLKATSTKGPTTNASIAAIPIDQLRALLKKYGR